MSIITMSEDSTFVAKPRVRFSQMANIKESSEDLLEKKTAVKKNLPKIKNIISVKTPVKIVNFKKQLDNAINTNILPTDDTAQKESIMCYEERQSMSGKINDCISQDQLIYKAVDEESSTNSYGMGNLKDNSLKQGSKVSEKSCSTFSVTTNNKDLCKALKPTNNVIKNVSKRSMKIKVDEGKENKNSSIKKVPFLVTEKKVVKPLRLKTIHIKEKGDVAEINVKKLNLQKHDMTNLNTPCTFNIDKQAKKTVNICTKPPWKNSSKHFSGTNVMPCYKYKKALMKNKTSPVKKSIIHGVAVPNVKAYVAFGIPKKLSHFDVHQTGRDINIVSNVTSSDKLSHPEFNSIVCVSTKLNEAKNEKIVTDVEHLPTTYKNILNEKISNALDFPLNEIIYKNLVDLSINEKQFSCKIMRSRDPHPRERDLVPKLSDFFIPKSTEEYYTSMPVKSRNSDIIESWNAFRISDKICEWKDNMDS